MRLIHKLLLLASIEETPWVGFDLDATLAVWHEGQSPTTIGKPIPKAILLVKKYIKKGMKVKIVTARVASSQKDRKQQLSLIEKWLKLYIGKKLEITSEKDPYMICLYDDKAIQVKPNSGHIAK